MTRRRHRIDGDRGASQVQGRRPVVDLQTVRPASAIVAIEVVAFTQVPVGRRASGFVLVAQCRASDRDG